MTYRELLGRAVGLPYLQALRLLAFYSSELCQSEGSGWPSSETAFSTRLHCYHNISRRAASLLGKLQESVPNELQRSFGRALARWQQGTPLAYILGIEEFAGSSFAVGPGALLPREDSEVLLQQALALCREPPGKVLELCCGTACISISLYLKRAGTAWANCGEVWASDISPQALAYAEQNREHYLAECNFQLRLSDLFAHPDLRQKYALIIANPPYLSEAEYQRRSACWQEPPLALRAGTDGMAVLRQIIAAATNYLQPGGSLLLEAAPWQIHELSRLLLVHGYEQLTIQRDSRGLERVIGSRYWPPI